MEKTLYNIYKTFFKMGTLLLGGGFVILPVMQAELVEKHGWVSEDELCEYCALSQSIPGLIAANLSIFIGYKLKKIKGAVAATLGLITPPFFIIIIFAKILEEIVHIKLVQNLFWGVGIGVLLLIFLAVKELWNKSIVDKTSFTIFFITFVLSACLKTPPATIVVIAILLGFALTLGKRVRQ